MNSEHRRNRPMANSMPNQSLSEGGLYELEVTRVIEETADARSFVLVPDDAYREAFRYRPGQFLTFEIPMGEQVLRRCYSMSSSPQTDGDLCVTVKRVPDGVVSNWFNDRVHPGSRLQVLPPAGRFTLRDGNRPIFLLAGGSGITPIISLIKSALAEGNRPITLLYANRSRASIIFRETLDQLERINSHRLTLVHHIDEEAGMLDPRRAVPWSRLSPDADIYLCGPAAFMDSIEAALHELNVSHERIFIEKFVSPAELTPPTTGDVKGVACRVTVWSGGYSQTIEAEPGETLLHAARRAGIAAPSACEQGVCGTCLATLSHGSARMQSNLLLTEHEVSSGLVLTCQALATSDQVEIRYD